MPRIIMDTKGMVRDFVGAFLLCYGAFTIIFYSGAASSMIWLGTVAGSNAQTQITGTIIVNSLLSAAGFVLIRLKLK
jgi:hypothetical protein